MYIHMCICVHIKIHTYIHIHAYIPHCVRSYMQTYTDTYMYVCIYVYIYIHSHPRHVGARVIETCHVWTLYCCSTRCRTVLVYSYLLHTTSF